MAKDFVTLLGPGGDMRAFFMQATGNADWVPGIYDELVTQLKESYTYFPLGDEKECGAWLNWLEQHPRFVGYSIFKTPEGWQAAIAIDQPNNFITATRPVLIDATYTIFAEFQRVVGA